MDSKRQRNIDAGVCLWDRKANTNNLRLSTSNRGMSWYRFGWYFEFAIRSVKKGLSSCGHILKDQAGGWTCCIQKVFTRRTSIIYIQTVWGEMRCSITWMGHVVDGIIALLKHSTDSSKLIAANELAVNLYWHWYNCTNRQAAAKASLARVKKWCCDVSWWGQIAQ